jgi:hypothetical protein
MNSELKIILSEPQTIINVSIPFACHCEPEGRGNLALGLLRRFTPRNDKLFNVFVSITPNLE